MRILQLANLIHPTSGGLRTVVEQLGAGYRAVGHERIVITPGRRHSRTLDADGGLRITLPGRLLPGAAGYRLLIDRDRLRDLLSRLRPDALEISDRFTLTWAVPWARDRGIPTTVIVHERLGHVLRTWTPLGQNSERIAQRLDHHLVKTIGDVVVPSRYAAEAFPPGRAQVVPWGVDLGTFRPSNAVDRARVDGGGTDPVTRPVRLVTVGRLSREKRPKLAIDTLVQLLARGRSAHLDVIGDGPLRADLRASSRQLPVTFHGHLPRTEVAARLVAADIAVSTCPAEVFGLAALEALASGVPILVPAAGALPELLDSSPGEFVVTAAGATAPPTGAGFATAAERILDHHPQERQNLALARAKCYRWSRAVDAFLERHEGDATRAVA